MKHLLSFRTGFLLIAALIWQGCRNNEAAAPNPMQYAQPGNEYLVSARLLGEYTTSQISKRTLVPLPLQYSVRVYKVVYKTRNTDGTSLQASGSLLVPVTANNRIPKGLISQQHGTITNDADAPSYYNPGSESYTFGSALASLGYAIACPDYIGYGESKQVPHPYEHRQSLASSSLDMIRAVHEFFGNNKITGFEKLFITGYSEGGFATLSLQKMIEEEFADDFNLVASSCGAGAYHKSRFMEYLVAQNTPGNSDFNRSYVYTLLTYNRVYGLNRPTTYYFKEPYAAEVQARQQDARINVSLSQAFTTEFKQAVLQPGNEFARAVADNDVHDWKPETPTRLYHGTADTFVFYFNSESAYNAMRARGATQVTLVTLPNQDHESGVAGFALGTYQFFESFIEGVTRCRKRE